MVGVQATPIRNRPEDPQPAAGPSNTGDADLRMDLTRSQNNNASSQDGASQRGFPQNPPAENVEQQLPAAPIEADAPVRRKRWTNEENQQLIRTYYKVTRLETDRTMYRQRLHANFIQKFPYLNHLNEQRIADQRRAIIVRNLLPPLTLEQIKEEVRRELNQDQIAPDAQVGLLEPEVDEIPNEPTYGQIMNPY